MNEHYLKSLATYQAINMLIFVLLSTALGATITLSGALVCFALGVLVHRFFGYKSEEQ